MKRMVCECCGMSDMLKQDDFMVCQYCGAKYTIEDARNLIVEVTGTVNVANAAQEENLLKMAAVALDSGNNESAENFCNQVIAMNASSYDAWKMKAKAISHLGTGAQNRLKEALHCLKSAFPLAKTNGKEELFPIFEDAILSEIKFRNENFLELNSKDNKDRIIETFSIIKTEGLMVLKGIGFKEKEAETTLKGILSDCFKELYALIDKAYGNIAAAFLKSSSFHNDWPYENEWDRFEEELDLIILLGEEIVELLSETADADCLVHTLDMANKVSQRVLEVLSNHSSLSKDQLLAEPKVRRRKAEIRERNKRIAKLYEAKKRHLKEEQDKWEEAKKKAIASYWETHKEEYISLNRQIGDIERELASLRLEIHALIEEAKNLSKAPFESPNKDTYASFQKEIDDKTKTLSSLGIFKMKEKKELKEQIEALNKKALSLKETLQEEETRFLEKNDFKIKDIKKSVSEKWKAEERLNISLSNLRKSIENVVSKEDIKKFLD